MLPFEPEPIDALRARYPQAVALIFALDLMRSSSPPWPGSLRSQVFDCQDGLRLVVYRQKTGRHPLNFHVLASAPPESAIMEAIYRGDSPTTFVEAALSRFRDVSGDLRPIQYDGFIPSNGKFVEREVCHWFRQEREVAVA